MGDRRLGCHLSQRDARMEFLREHAIEIVGVIVAAVAAWYSFRLFRKQNARWKKEELAQQPGVSLRINGTPSIDGWRGANLHVSPPPGGPLVGWQVQGSGWRIDSARLVSPRGAKLAFRRDDDHGLKGPIAGLSPRTISGRPNSHPQPYSIEFFIRLPATPHGDRGHRVRMKAVLRNTIDPERKGQTLSVFGAVPHDALSQPPPDAD